MSEEKVMGIREYARHRGCSHVAVLKAIDAGRLYSSVRFIDGKKRIDVDLADKEWDENTTNINDFALTFESLDKLIDEVMEIDIDELLK